MRYFVCLVDPEGRGIPEAMRRRYEALPRARGLEFVWHPLDQAAAHAAVLTVWDDPWGDPLVTQAGDRVAVGMVRLDNRPELERRAECPGDPCTDLELARRMVARHGAASVPHILGDFAFVSWDGAARTVVAATDAFAVKKLYHTEHDGLLAFASRAEALALDERYDVQFLAEYVTGCVPTPGLSPYAGVTQLPPGTFARGGQGKLTVETYWSADRFDPDPALARNEREAAETCRDLLADSVRLRFGPSGTTWAQLSGGLDSSSIVSVAQWMAERGVIPEGLAGTVTFVDRQGTESDERKYSDAVAQRWNVRNETIVDPPFWLDDEADPPRIDRPRDAMALYPRERRLLATVRGAGGRVLLTGFAGDELFTGTMYFFADWLAKGRIGPAVRELARRAAIGRVSFWELAFRNALLPLLPRGIRNAMLGERGGVLPWVQPAAVRRYGLATGVFGAAQSAGPIGRKYHHAVITNVTGLSRRLDAGFLGDGLDVRYPFLYRPLVEFALRLPPELCARPQARKWVLREAMDGILPDVVRGRVGKGGVTSVYGWSLAAQRPLLEVLVQEPILAELGIIDAAKLRAAVRDMPNQPQDNAGLHTALQPTLITEAWLQSRSGRWPPRGRLRSAVPQYQPSRQGTGGSEVGSPSLVTRAT